MCSLLGLWLQLKSCQTSNFVLDSDREREQIILAMESKCEMSEPNHKMIDWFRKIGCVHSIKMCKWWGRERAIRQTMSHPSVTTEGLKMKHHFELQQQSKPPITHSSPTTPKNDTINASWVQLQLIFTHVICKILFRTNVPPKCAPGEFLWRINPQQLTWAAEQMNSRFTP